MKLSRLFQPRNPLFWMAMALNALIGIWLAWRLIRDEPPAPEQVS